MKYFIFGLFLSLPLTVLADEKPNNLIKSDVKDAVQHEDNSQNHKNTESTKHLDICVKSKAVFHCDELTREDAISSYEAFINEFQKDSQCTKELSECKKSYDKWHDISLSDADLSTIVANCNTDVSFLTPPEIVTLAQKRDDFIKTRDKISSTYAKYDIDTDNIEKYSMLEKCTHMYAIVEAKIDEITAKESSAKVLKRYDGIAKEHGLGGVYVSTFGVGALYGGGLEFVIFDISSGNVSSGLVKQYAIYEGESSSNWDLITSEGSINFYKNHSNAIVGIEENGLISSNMLFVLQDSIAFKEHGYKDKKVLVFKILK